MKCLLVFMLIGLAIGEQSYNGYNVLRIYPTSTTQLSFLHSFRKDYANVDFWQEPVSLSRPTDMMVTPQKYKEITKALTSKGIAWEVHISNVQELIFKERVSQILSRAKSAGSKAYDIGSFHSHSEINAWLTTLATSYPNLATTEDIGKTYEQRTMRIIKIGTDPSKPIVWIDGGIHAREWISPATVSYFINKLITEYSTDAEIKMLVDNLNWHILPVHNPDGYEYSRTKSRLWRKTRQPTGQSSWWQGECIGTDPNRNWDDHWGQSGTSSDGCSDIYRGKNAESEPCVKNVADYIRQNKANMIVYISFHSYSQYWLTPWGWTYSLPSDYSDLKNLADQAVAALTKVHGTKFSVGSVTQLLYTASGGSMDWAKSSANIKYSYTLELRDTGRYGFVAPASEIIPSGEECWAGVKVVVKAVGNLI